MYREHAGPGVPDPWAAAKTNARNCGYLQLGAVGMTGVSLLLGGLQFATSPGMRHLMATETGAWIVAGVVGYLVVLGAWAALNAWGLNRRSKIAHWSSLAMAIVMILSCFSWVFGAALLMLLHKKEMKGFYESDLPTV